MIDNVNGDLNSVGPYGLDEDDNTYTVVCGGCNGTGQAYIGKFSPRPTTCRECLGLGEVEAA